MGSHTPTGPVLLAPRASVTTLAGGAKSWFAIRAKADDHKVIEIYDDIGSHGVSAKSFTQAVYDAGVMEAARVDVRIHSFGGDVMDGFVIYNLLRAIPGEVHGFIDGVAASMAGVVATACKPLHIPENGWFHMHKPWGAQGGDSDEMRDYADWLDRNQKNLVAAYSRKTGLSEAEIIPMLKPDTWMTGAEAVAAGFADVLEEPIKAAAHLTSQRYKEFDNMPDAVKSLMKPRAQAPGTPATPQPQGGGDTGSPQGGAQPTPTPQPAPAQQPQGGAQPAATMEQFRAQEQARRAAVAAVFQPFGETHAQLQRECLDDMEIDAVAAKDKLLAALGAGTTPTAPNRRDTHAFADNGNIVGDGIRNCVEARVGLGQAEKDNAYAGMTLMECARASLADRGIGIAAYGGDRLAIVGAAFTHTSSDFGHLLADVARKAMLKGYEEADETFTKWTAKGTLPDFRPMKRVDMTTFPSLRKVAEGAEYKYASVGDRGEQIVLATYGELLSITRQAIINDDLSAFNRLPRMMGRAAIRTVGDLVYALLGSAHKMDDGKALFHADHGNLMSAAALSVSRFDEGKTLMRRQKEGKAVLNIRPAYQIVPVSLESTAKALLAAEYDPAMAEAKVPNPVRGLVEVIADARLDEQSVSTSYMAADPNQYDTIEVAYLDGNDAPYLEQQQGFTTDGAVFKVRIDAGVAPLSYRTMVKMPGN